MPSLSDCQFRSGEPVNSQVGQAGGDFIPARGGLVSMMSAGLCLVSMTGASAQQLLVPPLPDPPENQPAAELPEYPAFTARAVPRVTLSAFPAGVLTAVIDEGARITTLDGVQLRGQVRSISQNGTTVRLTSGEERLIPAAKLLRISNYHPETESKETPADLKLIDGTLIVGVVRSFVSAGAEVSLGDKVVTVSRDFLGAVRFSDDPLSRSAWQQLLTKDRPAEDLLIVTKGEGVLESYRGVVSSVDERQIKFLIKGREVALPRAKAYGIIFAQNQTAKLPDAVCEVTSAGYRVKCKSVALTDGVLRVESVHGIPLELNHGNYGIDFTISRAASLAALSPVVRKWNPLEGVADSDALDALLAAKSEPVSFRSALVGGEKIERVTFQGVLSLDVPLRRNFLTMTVRSIASSNQNAIVSVRLDEQPPVQLFPRKDSEEKVAQYSVPVSDVRLLKIDITSPDPIVFEDLLFIRAVR